MEMEIDCMIWQTVQRKRRFAAFASVIVVVAVLVVCTCFRSTSMCLADRTPSPALAASLLDLLTSTPPPMQMYICCSVFMLFALEWNAFAGWLLLPKR